MSSPIHLRRGFAGLVLAAALAMTLPAAAQAAPVNLATAAPFAVLAGTTVTNTGPSVFNGELGLWPGTEIEGFTFPAKVNGATHVNDEVAAQAQLDLTKAYDAAAGQAVEPADDLSGTDLGERKLSPGAYRYTSDALLTGALTLDAEGDPNAQFVFLIGSELKTESASSVLLVNGASPCNVYWQVGSSADIGTTTAFQGSVLALTSISLKNGATVLGRMLARNGQVSLINNVITRPLCETDPTDGSDSDSDSAGTAGTDGTAATGGNGSAGGPGRAISVPSNRARKAPRDGTATFRPTPRERCTEGFRATVTGKRIERVVFRLDGERIGSRAHSPFAMSMRAAPGEHRVSVRVTFEDATRAKTRTLPYRACAAAPLRPKRGPSEMTG
ncbi:MAG TPA: ice-binding family protein [Solirubrobacterales bacterium]|nr:ice-binding family protein [Solirubrobacterales bacterium]